MRFLDQKEQIRILLLENIHPAAVERLKADGFKIETAGGAWSESELVSKAKGFHALGIRSKTQVRKPVLDALSEHICVIGAFCIGTDQVDLAEANKSGVAVFNAPHSNTRSVAEMVISHVISLSRRLGDSNLKAHQGIWLKSAKGSHEIRGKTLGIIGYGHIGSQVSVLAEAMGMRVVFYDVIKKLPLGNATAAPNLDKLLQDSDFVTLHVPDTTSTKKMFDDARLKKMKKGSFLINASRGSVVEIPALALALKSGHVGGAAIDVFPFEPANNEEPFTSELRGIDNVILTPHIGGSTEEAQEAIGREVAESFSRYFKQGSTAGAVNFPQVDIPAKGEAIRMINVHKNVPGVLGKINSIVSEMNVNIGRQLLSTDQSIGYLVMDMEIRDAQQVATRIAQLPTSIHTRLI